MLTRFVLFLLSLYRIALSPFFGRVCRFEPSCSKYAMACIENRGVVRGGLLSLARLCKCHPFHPGGLDLPPPPYPVSSPLASSRHDA